jgi:DNA-binding NtrC family response regulator
MNVPRRRPLRVMIVEDEDRLRELLLDELPRMGFEADGARTGEAAERLMRESPVDIVMLDLNLPVMDGMMFLDRLRQHDKRTAVIIMTGFGSLEAAQRAIHHDVAAFLTKPCHLGDIEQALDRARRKLEETQMEPATSEEMAEPQGPPGGTMAEIERQAILEALRRNGNNRSAAAVELGISRRTLYNKLEEYARQGLELPED